MELSKAHLYYMGTQSVGQSTRTGVSTANAQEKIQRLVHTTGLFFILLVGFAFLCGAAWAYATPESIVATGNVYVSNVTYDPGAFFSGDSGTVTYTVTNGNANTSVVVNHATYTDSKIQLTSGTYDTSSNLGPLQSRTYTFSIATTANEGDYYPTFSLDFRDGSSLYYRGLVKIDDTPLVMSIQDKPDAFTQGKKDTISVQIANPRENSVKNVIFKVSGNDVTLTPDETYIGTLAAGESKLINFTAMPDSPTTLSMNVTYDNGDNPHEVDLSLPVDFTRDKQQANPVMSNVVTTFTGGVYHVAGDVTNAGLLTANGVTVTSLAPAVAEDPYRTYVIGALKPDDFGSYELTFTAPEGTTSIPLQTSYKDKDGNVISSVQQVGLSGVVKSKNPDDGPGMLPIIVVIIIIAAGAGGYFYMKKRKNQ
ncbi:MAG: CARDB domain-containing protein [Methanoregula sp.]|jgi:hypothetical protein